MTTPYYIENGDLYCRPAPGIGRTPTMIAAGYGKRLVRSVAKDVGRTSDALWDIAYDATGQEEWSISDADELESLVENSDLTVDDFLSQWRSKYES